MIEEPLWDDQEIRDPQLSSGLSYWDQWKRGRNANMSKGIKTRMGENHRHSRPELAGAHYLQTDSWEPCIALTSAPWMQLTLVCQGQWVWATGSGNRICACMNWTFTAHSLWRKALLSIDTGVWALVQPQFGDLTDFIASRLDALPSLRSKCKLGWVNVGRNRKGDWDW